MTSSVVLLVQDNLPNLQWYFDYSSICEPTLCANCIYPCDIVDGDDEDDRSRTAIIIVIVCLVIVILVAIAIITWAGLKRHYRVRFATFGEFTIPHSYFYYHSLLEHKHPDDQSSRDHPETVSSSAYVPMISADSPTTPQELKFPEHDGVHGL